MRVVVLLLAALALSGCAQPLHAAPPTAPPSAAVRRVPSFDAAVLAAEACVRDCHEPSVAADPLGRLFATSEAGDKLVRSDDGGRTWIAIDPPRPAPGAPPSPPPTGAPTQGDDQILARADALVQVDARGRLYFSNVAGDAQGVQVARSDDGGQTWASNVFVAPSPPLPGIVDRPWLAFGAGDVVVLTFSQVPTGLYVAVSRDAGATFGAFARIAAGQDRGTGYEGPPLVEPGGRILVPFAAGAPPTLDSRIVVASSDDDGATWRNVTVHATSDGSQDAGWAPVLALVAPERLAVAWPQTNGSAFRLAVARSDDDGRSWTAPADWGPAYGSIAPWLAGGGGRLDAAWHAPGIDVMFGRDEGAGPSEVRIASSVTATHTDESALAWLPDGRAVVAWNDGNRLLVATEASGAEAGIARSS